MTILKSLAAAAAATTAAGAARVGTTVIAAVAAANPYSARSTDKTGVAGDDIDDDNVDGEDETEEPAADALTAVGTEPAPALLSLGGYGGRVTVAAVAERGGEVAGGLGGGAGAWPQRREWEAPVLDTVARQWC